MKPYLHFLIRSALLSVSSTILIFILFVYPYFASEAFRVQVKEDGMNYLTLGVTDVFLILYCITIVLGSLVLGGISYIMKYQGSPEKTYTILTTSLCGIILAVVGYQQLHLGEVSSGNMVLIPTIASLIGTGLAYLMSKPTKQQT